MRISLSVLQSSAVAWKAAWLGAGMFCMAPALAGQREVLTGNVVRSGRTDEFDFYFQYKQDREPVMAFLSELGGDEAILKTWPNQRFEVIRDVFVSAGGADERIPVWPRETDRGTMLRLLPSELLAPAGVPLSPERWAGASTSLHPTLHANQPFEVSGPADYDGDGVADDVDAFPDNPGETADTDQDGTGNNADPDDDNDAMSDAYEQGNGLDPLANDAEQDPDSDGFTNVQESAAGTAAQNGGSYFHVESAEFITPEKIELKWHALPGRRYEVWHRPQLTPRGERLEQDLRVTVPGTLSTIIPVQEPGDFYFVFVIADPL